MLDRTIPFYNMILRCVSYRDKNVVLPEGFSIVSYKNGYEKSWAELEYSVGDFNSLEDALLLSFMSFSWKVELVWVISGTS